MEERDLAQGAEKMTHAISSERLLLRELDPRDCSPAYIAWLEDPEIHQYLETRHTSHDEQSVTAFINAVNARSNEFLFGIFLRGTARHIGNIKVGPIHPHHKIGDMSLFVGARDCWGKGFASEAIQALSAYSFEELGVLKLNASMYAPNTASKRAFEKVGYRQEGLRRSHYQLGDQRCDVVELGLLPNEIER